MPTYDRRPIADWGYGIGSLLSWAPYLLEPQGRVSFFKIEQAD